MKPDNRLDEILASFEGTSEPNPSDEEFDRPSNFPDKVDVDKVSSSTDLNNPDLNSDYAHVRDVYRHLIGKGILTLEGAINIAKETENARAIEVVSQMMNTISEMSTKLLKLHENAQKASAAGRKQESPKTLTQDQSPTNNIYILGEGKSAKDILNDMLGTALADDKVIEGEVDDDR
jgi:hypothetical protein